MIWKPLDTADAVGNAIKADSLDQFSETPLPPHAAGRLETGIEKIEGVRMVVVDQILPETPREAGLGVRLDVVFRKAWIEAQQHDARPRIPDVNGSGSTSLRT